METMLTEVKRNLYKEKDKIGLAKLIIDQLDSKSKKELIKYIKGSK